MSLDLWAKEQTDAKPRASPVNWENTECVLVGRCKSNGGVAARQHSLELIGREQMDASAREGMGD